MRYFSIDETAVVQKTGRDLEHAKSAYGLIIRREGKSFAVYDNRDQVAIFETFDAASKYVESFNNQ